jgi:16S rRNA (cytosine967-C5)-methyltransferase
MTVRLAAARILLNIEQGRTTLAAELERGRAALADERDRALLFELTAGVLRWRNELDAVIAQAAGRGTDSIDTPVRTVLRLGAYQVRHLSRVPAHAIVHESVETVRALGAARAASFVNAVLRAITRMTPETDPIAFGPPTNATRAEQVAYLSVAQSHPAWLVSRWLDRYGAPDTLTWCAYNNSSPLPGLRWRDGRPESPLAALAAAGIDAAPGAFVTTAARVAPGLLGHVPPDLRAALVVQDEGSQLVAFAVGALPGERVLDLCAAPGNKSGLLAAAVGPTGLLVSGDRRPRRLRLLRSTLAQSTPSHGSANPLIVGLDALGSLPFASTFDRVLLDAPCSGLGTLSRDPDLKWSRTEADLAGFALRQLAMLEQAAKVVRPGGRLVYATCSSEPDENGAVADAFLAAHDDFERQPVSFPAWIARQPELVDDRGQMVTSPARHGLDAYFAAVLARRRAA